MSLLVVGKGEDDDKDGSMMIIYADDGGGHAQDLLAEAQQLPQQLLPLCWMAHESDYMNTKITTYKLIYFAHAPL